MTSGADIAIAVGTIATAAIAAAGLAVSLVISKRDRDRANAQAADDRRSAADAAAADREATARLASIERAAGREDARRRHIIDLLLELGRQVARQHANSHDPVEGPMAVQQIILLLHALPAECAYLARKAFNATRQMDMAGGVGEKMQWLDYSSVIKADPQQMTHEIAFDIDRYMTSGRPIEETWNDLEELREWERRRWPRTGVHST